MYHWHICIKQCLIFHVEAPHSKRPCTFKRGKNWQEFRNNLISPSGRLSYRKTNLLVKIYIFGKEWMHHSALVIHECAESDKDEVKRRSCQLIWCISPHALSSDQETEAIDWFLTHLNALISFEFARSLRKTLHYILNCDFSCSHSTEVWIYYIENCRSKQLIDSEMHVVASLSWDENHSFF